MPTAVGSYATTATLKARLFAAGVTDTADDTLMGTICDQVNQFIEGPHGCRRVIAPVNSATYLVDGTGTDRLFFRAGLRAVSVLAVGDFTGDDRDAVTTFFLRPSTHDRLPGWPAEWLYLSDQGTRTTFPLGFETVSITATTGWAAIPDDLINVAVTTAVRAWHGRQNGQADIVGSDETGAPLVSKFVAPEHWGIVKGYRPLVRPR